MTDSENITPGPERRKPSETLYVRNLDESIKIPLLKESLDAVFSPYGNIVDIVAHGNIRMRGQAFVVFDDVESASEALDEVQGFELFDKPMVIQFAKTKSDVTVKQQGEEAFEEHKKLRLEAKGTLLICSVNNKRKRAGGAIAGRPAKRVAGPPDELLPPNKILFLQNLPDDIAADRLTEAFEKFPGFFEVRLVPGRKGIGFVEYETDENAVVAKEGTVGITFSDKKAKITFARK
ncbi:hypothetical protein V1520DRAFT_369635 [Lipomyces starkeyi]|uniref:RRM domain-containing protein n=1 Tax=Lipomyces starkeyi NRRL Y-11557 TaxID=675824 RepID=A0A1E3Q5M1_LIPST|nr:hypothetical protein LIPSTDRAFT_96089 [Lipomyces starkeyi NRRL Y-11557]